MADQDQQDAARQQHEESRQEDRRHKAAADIIRNIPHFVPSKLAWHDFVKGFNTACADYTALDDAKKKKTIFQCMSVFAQNLVGDELRPETPRAQGMSFKDYTAEITKIFEPPSESENLKMMFRARNQRPSEYPLLYMMEKHNLFQRAWSEPQRDYQFFYSKLIVGFQNQYIRDHMRFFLPENPKANSFPKSVEILRRATTMVKQKYLDGEISAADTLGAEYLVVAPPTMDVQGGPAPPLLGHMKTEPIFAIGNQQIENRRCYHCNTKGHYIAQCPRKAQGLPPAISSLEAQEEHYVEEESPICAFGQPRGRGRFRGGARGGYRPGRGIFYNRTVIRRGNNRPNFVQTDQTHETAGARNDSYHPTTKFGDRRTSGQFPNRRGNSHKFNRRIAYLYENDDGDTILEEEGEAAEPEPEAVEQVEEGVHALHLEEQEEDFSESDYLPGAFLGGI